MKGFIVKVNDLKFLSFPEYCIVCGRQYKGRYGTIEIGPVSKRRPYLPVHISMLLLIDKISSKEHVLSVPGHQKCIKSIRTAFWIRTLFYFLIAVPVFIIGIKYGLNRFYMFLICLVIAVPFIFWEFSHPLPINYEYRNGEYVFEFKDRDYAERFALLNDAKVEEL